MDENIPAGGPTYQHDAPVPQGTAHTDEALRAALEAHLSAHLPGEPMVLHEIVSEGVHLDVFVYPPTDERPAYTLVTVGMSEWPMTVPEGAEPWRRCELVLCLPPGWPLGGPGDSMQDGPLADEENYWPIRALKQAGHLPHLYDTWLSYGHSLASDDGEPYAGTDFTGLLVGPILSLPESFEVLEHEGERICFWGVYPLYPEEMDFKLEHGADAVFERLSEVEVFEGVFVDRDNIVR